MARKLCTSCRNYINGQCIHYNCAVFPHGICKHHIANSDVLISPDYRIERYEVENPFSSAERYLYHLYIDNNLEMESYHIKDIYDCIKCSLEGEL